MQSLIKKKKVTRLVKRYHFSTNC